MTGSELESVEVFLAGPASLPTGLMRGSPALAMKLLILVFMVYSCSTSSLDGSLAENIFLSNDPYNDRYIQTIVRMDRKQLKSIRIMDENEFITYLNSGNDTLNGLTVRSDSRISSVFDNTKLDDQLIGQPEIDEQWEDLVVAGPVAVNYVGHLMVLASKRDFPFEPNNSNYSYQYIRYPQSFRATLVQLSSEMYNTFLNAHNSMDRIQLNMEQIPRHVNTTVKLLLMAPLPLIQTLLPLSIENIQRITIDCTKLANSTLDKFLYLNKLLQEILAISIVTLGANENTLVEVQTVYNNSIKEHVEINSKVEEIKSRYEDAKLQLKAAQEEYLRAYHAIPTRILDATTRFLGGIVNDLFSVITQPLVQALGCIFGVCENDNRATLDNTAFENAKQKAELAKAALESAEKLYDDHHQQLQREQNKLVQIIDRMSKLNFDKLNTQELISILADATKQIIQIAEQWDKLLRFFTKLSAQADQTQNVILNEFVKQIQSVQEQNLLVDDAMREFFVSTLMIPASLIDRESHLLYIMAKTYYDISNSYMMNQLAGLSKFLIIQTDNERKYLLEEIASKTTATSAKISRLAMERHGQYQRRNKARQAEYQRFIDQQTITLEFRSVIGD
ncbi:unnamed protein product [Didymodactylos carnosus]|uniref:Uncharacterized protein n=1 Tax=Didymodactylos carnosus TaxID=1234261 RepID=A0A814UZW5_9BILA|nr:unnamed protein product [Didymodactylos carnosus]CAF3945673.1 unnamed protein product [Didymodactylos carnosus]